MIFRFLPSVCCSVLLFLSPVFSQETKRKWTPPPVDEIEELIEGGQRGAAGKLIRSKFGSKTLRSGRHWIAGTRVLWIAEAEEPVSVVEKGGEVIADLAALDDSGLQAAVVEVGNQRILTYEMVKGGAAFQSATLKIEFYPYPSESSYHDGIPRGSITMHSFAGSKIFPGTTRELQFYLPAQHRPGRELALIVFQDGLRHAQTDSAGGLRAPVVLDNLIAAGEIPVCGGIFINPGSLKDQPPGSKPRNRSLEYDSLGDAYVRFVTEEIIPFIEKEHGVAFSDDPKQRAIAGGSSGCACAWTAAWERPDQFGKVLGWVGTFVDIRGANAYPSLIRKTERKPIRAALLGERQDLDNRFGNWPLANEQMEKALAFQGYDYRYWWGDGFHGSRHAAVMLPEMLRWLFSDLTDSGTAP